VAGVILIKVAANTIEDVIANSKSASNTIPNAVKGDIVLISQTINTLSRGDKSIRYIMSFDECYEDLNNESEKLWGKKWKYIISCSSVQPIEAFNLEDIQISNHNYKPVVTHCKLHSEDEEAVASWIFNDENGLEFNDFLNDSSELLQQIDARYKGAPDYKERMIKYFSRPTAIRNAVVTLKGTKCQLCGYEGFKKKNSDTLYCEVHHMIELNKNAPKTLQTWNLIVVCPTCHRRLHYGNMQSQLNDDNQWEISFDGLPPIILS